MRGSPACAAGRQRPRVPKEEAEQVVEILKKNGRTVDVHYYASEDHGFAKRENQIDAIQPGLHGSIVTSWARTPHKNNVGSAEQRPSYRSYASKPFRHR
jgi:hypothetical protein